MIRGAFELDLAPGTDTAFVKRRMPPRMDLIGLLRDFKYGYRMGLYVAAEIIGQSWLFSAQGIFQGSD